jgi:hypothetical protein
MGLQVTSADGLSPREVLAALAQRARELVDRHARCFRDAVAPALAREGVHLRSWQDLDAEEQARLAAYFEAKVFPVLTPLAVDPSHPFPYISGLSLNLAVLVRNPDEDAQRFARVKVPNNVPRFVVVSHSSIETEYLPLEELIAAHLPLLFPGMDVVEHHVFRVTRNADVEVEEDRDEDLLQALERELMRRRFGPAVRLEVTDDIDDEVVGLLVSEIDVEADDVLRVPGLLDRVRADPSLAEGVVEEVLRLDPPVQMTMRTALADVPVPGGVLRKGGTAVLLIAAANRDRDAFPDPLTLDPERRDTGHLAFGGGIHFCLGSPLARLEGRVVVAELARRLVAPRLEELTYRENRVLRGPNKLVVGFDALLP